MRGLRAWGAACMLLAMAGWSVTAGEDKPAPEAPTTGTQEAAAQQTAPAPVAPTSAGQEEEQTIRGLPVAKIKDSDQYFVLGDIDEPRSNCEGAEHTDNIVAQNPQFISREICFIIPARVEFNIRDLLLYREMLISQLKGKLYTVYSIGEDRVLQRTQQQARHDSNASFGDDDDDDDDSAGKPSNGTNGSEGKDQQTEKSKPEVVAVDKRQEAEAVANSIKEAQEIARLAEEIRKSGIVSSFTINYAGKRINAEQPPVKSYGVIRAVMMRNNLGQTVVTLHVTESPGVDGELPVIHF